MSWQDELRRLDADLAAGRIGAADHRKQRDELLAQASGATVASPVPSPLRRPGEGWRSTNPANHPAPSQPAPPPQRIESPRYAPATPPPPPAPPPPWQRTGLPKTLSAAQVQAIPDHMTTAPSPADIVPTRYLQVDGPGEQEFGRRFPPITPPGGESAPRPRDAEPATPAGKHRFLSGDDEEDGSSRRTWPFIALGVLVVLALIGGATVWLGDDEPKSDALSTLVPTLPQPPAAAAQPQLEDQVPPLPGMQYAGSSTLSLAKGLDLNLYPKETAQIFSQHGVTQLVYRGSSTGDLGYLAFAVPTNSPEDAKAVVDYLRAAASSGGFSPLADDDKVVTGRNGDRRMDGTWYTSGKVAIVLWVSQPFGKNRNELKAGLDNALSVFQKALPPS
ncbi:hypothetical protein [Amycolatopsis sp. Hca4]|uniref:hypothetical protein n=1 Tax=Amycolatopsis sp. Hca4 TaxID=2742131 RepID=UPI0015920540|nr:hypothetical protein [Amycolatopsis sp. Hca4]QKV77001.1 hypothetical protein HUT10_26885 [Amycolatopsis sp. Hca4]